jgi:Zn-finger nucleic acid-binding protein
MNCPICKLPELAKNELDSQLSSLKCPQCKGDFIQGLEYWTWLEKHGPNLPEVAVDTSDIERSETTHPLDCPECRWRMVKYLVGHGTGFNLDHCHGCKGTWLDKNEWETLKARNLHDDIHSVLTAFWQSEAQREERRKRAETMLIAKIGAEDYSRIKSFREWLNGHERKYELIAYLTAADPLDH